MYSSSAQPESSSDWECLWLMSEPPWPDWPFSSFTSPDILKQSDSVFLKISTIRPSLSNNVRRKLSSAQMFPLKFEIRPDGGIDYSVVKIKCTLGSRNRNDFTIMRRGGEMIVNFFTVSAGQRGVIKTQTRQKNLGCLSHKYFSI